MTIAIRQILEQIRDLPEADKIELELQLAARAEAEWNREAETAQAAAKERGIDQGVIDETIENLRYPR